VKTLGKVNLQYGDASPELAWAARDAKRVSWDIETSGLDWSSDRIATVQVHVPDMGTEIIRLTDDVPTRLADLLVSESVTKVFHHAPFDLRFMAHHWNVRPAAIACTKILAKIVHPGRDSKAYSLKPLVQHYLGESLDKTQQVSNWFADELSSEQMEYAARDVVYLLPLLDRLRDEARSAGLLDVAETTFAYVPTRVATDLRGCGDVFAY